jgi:hypothetical protein
MTIGKDESTTESHMLYETLRNTLDDECGHVGKGCIRKY